ncbi:hypothetical protein ACK3SF_02685 [Candidatus Nanosalina sp. VS9-1]|uniref:hypothetical protein n=1 Tax=Candidatus Nanosalina sp. VS9-1 TaxID=3388566 RepID=UPI0039DF739D
MVNGRDDLMDLDYSAYDHVLEFTEELGKRRIDASEVEVSLGFHYEDDTPVLDVYGTDGRNKYIDSFRLQGLSPEVFESTGYELWVNAFEQDFEIGDVLEEFDNGRFRK